MKNRTVTPAPVPAGMAHETLIVPGSAYTVAGPHTGQEANLRNPAHYPAEAICQVCHRMVRREVMAPEQTDWSHTDRMPGEPAPLRPDLDIRQGRSGAR